MKCRKKCLIAMRLCSIVLFTSFVAASDRAQSLPAAPAIDNLSYTASVLSFAYRFEPPVAPWDFRPMPANNTRTKIDKGVARAFDKAWRISGDGTNNCESVVLIFRMEDGSYTGTSKGFTNEFRKFTFEWDPAALAIVHTHPNGTDPKPAEQDKRVADRFGVPNITLTISGMYVYDPATKKTSKVLDGLDWLNLSTYPEGLKKWFGGQTSPSSSR